MMDIPVLEVEDRKILVTMIWSVSGAFPWSLRCLGSPLSFMLVGKESNNMLHTNTLCLGTHCFPNLALAEPDQVQYQEQQ